MPNFNKPPMLEPVIREIIATNGGRLENRYFFLTLFAVLLLAVILLWTTVHKERQALRLPNQLSNLAIQLSIASDEIVMLQDVGLLSQAPTLNDLQEYEVEPFSSQQVLAPSENCFVLIQQQAVLRLIKLPEQHWQVQWQASVDEHRSAHPDELPVHDDNFCQAGKLWFSAAHSKVLDI